MFRKILLYRRFVKLARSVGYDLHDAHPVESLAFMTISASKLSPIKELKCNEIALYDTIIFTMFIVRMVCIAKINDRTNAEEFSNSYIKQVFEYFPEWQSISNKYDKEFFSERVKYYESLLADESVDDQLKNVVNGFKSIIIYDYAEKYVRFDKTTPFMLIDFDIQFKINAQVHSYYNTLPDLFGRLLPDVFKLYN